MDILVLSIVAVLVVIGGLWMASRDTAPVGKKSDELFSDQTDDIK